MATNLTVSDDIVGKSVSAENYMIFDGGGNFVQMFGYNPADAQTLQAGMHALRVNEIQCDTISAYAHNNVPGKLTFQQYTAIDFGNTPIENWAGPQGGGGNGFP